ncbi:MAG: glycosyltransferase family 4 protein [Candidatus Nanopelagicales bacterium]
MTSPATQPRTPGAEAPLRVLFCNWRDTRNPEGGGSEVYVESVATALAASGHEVTILCAAHDNGAADETVDGVRFLRHGSKLGVYPQAFLRQLLHRVGPFDVVVDVQNGIPFLSTWTGRTPVVVLVHHVHREQWPVVYGPLRSRIGWWIESRLAPRAYRGSPYVAVSEATRHELVELGVRADDVTVVHNGCERPVLDPDPADHPRILVLGRLVPHKRVEHVLAAAAALREDHPTVRVAVVGDGWWSASLAEEAERLGVTDLVEFTGFVDEEAKHRELSRAWVLALPSLKEGWGLVVMEAAGYAVPTVGYAAAGGVAESVVDGVTGILVDDEAGFTAALRRLLDDPELRRRMGMAAEARTWEFGWDTAARSFARVLARAAGRPELETALEAVPEIEPAHIHHDPVDPPAATDPGTTMAATP